MILTWDYNKVARKYLPSFYSDVNLVIWRIVAWFLGKKNQTLSWHFLLPFVFPNLNELRPKSAPLSPSSLDNHVIHVLHSDHGRVCLNSQFAWLHATQKYTFISLSRRCFCNMDSFLKLFFPPSHPSHFQVERWNHFKISTRSMEMECAFILFQFCSNPLSCCYGNRLATVVEETMLRLSPDGGSWCQWQHPSEAVCSSDELELGCVPLQ